MKKHLRRYAAGALAIGAIAGGIAIALPANVTAAMEWHPARYGLTETPDAILPTIVSAKQPIRVVSTTLDRDGKPVIKVETVTNKSAAARAVKAGQSAKNAVGVEVDAVVSATSVPAGTDTYRAQQWDFSKIRVADAWQNSTGAGVTVAVIDSGVDAAHPDLQGNVLSGYDAIANQAGVSTDPNGHGTHVAGTIAAVTGNGVGVSAIAPDTKILPVKVLDANGSGYMSDTAEGIIWATDHGAGVINMSLGSGQQVTAVTNAIAYARSKGVVVVASAGNSRAAGSPTNWPAADAGVIGVAATDSADRIASFSTAGSYVDVAAPGVGIISTMPTAKGSYGSMNGTSMAAPHVAAVAALLKASQPALTPDQVQAALQSSAVDLGAAGRDNDFGYGRIDAVAALAAASGSSTSPTTTSPVPTPSKTTSSPTPTPTKTTAVPTPAKPTTSPTPTPSKTIPVMLLRPTVKVTTTATAVVHGTNSTVTYTVTAAGKAWANKPVQIGAAAVGSPTFAWTDAATDGAGRVTASFRAIGGTQIKLSVLATDASLAVMSPVTTFSVRSTATVTSPAKGSLKFALKGAVGQQVQVQRYDRNRWVVTATFPADQAETVLTELSAGTYRVVVPTTTAVIGVTTGSIKIA